MHFSAENTFHRSGEIVQKYGILVQNEKAAESSAGDHTCHMFGLEETVVHLKSNFMIKNFCVVLPQVSLSSVNSFLVDYIWFH